MVATPPRSTFSRAPWANDQGPYPVRSLLFSLEFRRKSAQGGVTILADFAFEAMKRQLKRPGTVAMMEQPEDLGSTSYERSMRRFAAWRGSFPRSFPSWIWAYGSPFDAHLCGPPPRNEGRRANSMSTAGMQASWRGEQETLSVADFQEAKVPRHQWQLPGRPACANGRQGPSSSRSFGAGRQWRRGQEEHRAGGR